MNHDCEEPCLYCMVSQLYGKIEQLKKDNFKLAQEVLNLKEVNEILYEKHKPWEDEVINKK